MADVPVTPARLPDPSSSTNDALAVVLQVRGHVLSVLLWQRAREPFANRWALPGGPLREDEDLGESIRRQLAEKVDVRELSHLEQLKTRSAPDRDPTRRSVATAYLGLVPLPADPALPCDTRWHDTAHLPRMAYDHGDFVMTGIDRLRSKLSYTNVGFALAAPDFTVAELAAVYRAALGYEVAPTNLARILLRRKEIELTGRRTPSGRAGGRPAAVYRFRNRELRVTDPFAVLAPPRRG